MKSIKVVIHGALGRMGQEVLSAVCRDAELEPVGAVERTVTEEYLPLPDSSGAIPFSSDLESILTRCHPHVVVDFSHHEATMTAVRIAVRHRVGLVIGTTGLSATDLSEISELCKANEVGAVVAPNFALGAVLMIHMAKVAARFFDYASITELHHHQKADAPSGTALTTAKEMVEARGKPFHYVPTQQQTLAGTRGGLFEGISLHSVRMPGLLAHQEVILGGPGQTLRIRHDTISRECFIPGVIMAIKGVIKLKGLVCELDSLLGLKETS